MSTLASQLDVGAGALALVIEGCEACRTAMAACMELAGCRVEQVDTVDAAFAALERRRFALLVWGPSSDEVRGRVEVTNGLRRRTEAPLVVVDDDMHMGQVVLDAGADQWLAKPFVPGTLVGAIRAALRRAASPMIRDATRVEVHGMVLDGRSCQLSYGSVDISFTRQEWDLLSILVSYPNRFLGAQEILRLGWRAGDHAADQLRTYVHRLRQKFGLQHLPFVLASEHRKGYCLMFDTPRAAPRTTAPPPSPLSPPPTNGRTPGGIMGSKGCRNPGEYPEQAGLKR
jgi:DNA-binding response OmpR family regulator